MGSGLKEGLDWRVWQAEFSLVKAGEIFYRSGIVPISFCDRSLTVIEPSVNRSGIVPDHSGKCTDAFLDWVGRPSPGEPNT
jgi:hypothetical protein